MNLPGAAARLISTARIAVVFVLVTGGAAQGQVATASLPGDPCIEPAVRSAETALADASTTHPSNADAASAIANATDPLLRQMITQRYPEIAQKQIRIRTFHSNYDYFRTRFSLSRFLLLRRMRYFVEVNPRLLSLSPPPHGVCAILGHELAHVASMSHGSRIKLFGLVRLLGSDYTARFERRTDLEAIHRGFAPGLKAYRAWIYVNIPQEKVAAKKKNYFTPSEIDAVLVRLQREPGIFDNWTRHVPLNMEQIEGPVHR